MTVSDDLGNKRELAEKELDKIFGIYNYDNTSLAKFDFTYEITLPEEFP